GRVRHLTGAPSAGSIRASPPRIIPGQEHLSLFIPPVTTKPHEIPRLAPVDDPIRIHAYRDLRTAPPLADRIDTDLHAAMLYFSFWPSGRGGGLREGLEDLRSRPHLVTEVLDVLAYREQISRILPRPLSGHLASTPLRSHAHYSREELLAGLGLGTLDPGAPGLIREGVKWLPA